VPACTHQQWDRRPDLDPSSVRTAYVCRECGATGCRNLRRGTPIRIADIAGRDPAWAADALRARDAEQQRAGLTFGPRGLEKC
jgi:hypothetical protein